MYVTTLIRGKICFRVKDGGKASFNDKNFNKPPVFHVITLFGKTKLMQIRKNSFIS